MNIGTIIKEFRRMHQLSMDEFADRSGLSKSYISMLEKNVNTSTGKPIAPTIDAIKKIAKAMNTDIDDLIVMLGENEISLRDDNTSSVSLPKAEPVTTIQVYDFISCGHGTFVDDNIVSEISVPNSLLPRAKKDLFAQYARGDSMIGAGINDGDLLIFSKETCESGQIGCFCIGENIATCKRLRVLGNQIVLMPANDKYDPILVEPDQFKCVGKLILKINKV